MRDTSLWSGDPMTSTRTITAQVRQRHPNFRWHFSRDYYSIQTLGETWGDSPGTYAELRERDLPTRQIYGGFAVMGDSVTLSDSSIFRVTSLRAGNQGDTMLWKVLVGPSSLTSMNTLSLSTPARVWTGIGLASHSLLANIARLFYIRSSNNKMVYRDCTTTGIFGTIFEYTGSPAFDFDGVAIAPITDDEGFVISYDKASYKVTLHRFQAGAWTSSVMPMRYAQHPLNCHWFDAVSLGTSRLITFCVNGVQYATIYDTHGFRDPWPVIAFTAEYGGAQTRICKLTNIGDRVVATAWSRFAGSSDDYEASYYHLMWTDDGVNWAVPEEGFIGQVASRGKLHVQGDQLIIPGASVAYVGDAVTWLGGTVGVKDVSAQVVGHNIVQDLDQASDLKLSLLLPSDFDHSLLQYGNEVVYQLGLVGESAIDIARLTMDTPGHAIDGYGQQIELVCRGALKKLISFTSPMDQTIDSALGYHFDFKQGGLYARQGVWSHDPSGIAFTAGQASAANNLATIGIQYKGQFQISARVRVTEAIDGCTFGIVFWYEGPQDYYRLDITPELGGRAVLRRIEAGLTTALANVDVVAGIVADTWYNLIVRYTGGTLTGYILPDPSFGWEEFVSFSDWDRPEPTAWYAGLFCAIPVTTLTQSLDQNATHRVDVKSTTGYPSSGEIKIDNEIIRYSSKTATRFGSGSAYSLVRGVRSLRANHAENAPVAVAERRFEADFFTIFQDDRPMSVADACAYLVTCTGVPFQSVTLVDDSSAGVRVFPELHSHSWVLSGEYTNDGFTLYFWTDTSSPPQSGIKVAIGLSSGSYQAVLSDIVGGNIERQPVSISSSGTFRCRVEKNTILLWVNDQFLCGFVVPGERTFRVGSVACNGNVTRLIADELFEAAEGIVWSMQESARDVLQRLLQGRDARLRERSDGRVQVTQLEVRDDLGSLSGQYFVTYQRAAADDQWASAMVAWGAEDWVMVMAPGADRLRWVKWQTPHIYDRETLRKRAMHRLRKLWSLKDVRAFSGPFDPRIEVGDELTIDSISGIPIGKYMVRAIEIIGDPKQLDMNVTVQALPDDIAIAVWPIMPGVSRPSAGT